MAPFPSPLERTVASALLLLSTKSGEEESESLSLVSSGGSKSKSRSSSSCSVVTTHGSSHEIRAHKLKIIAAVARCQEMKPKVVKKSRSKVCFSSWKPAKEASGSVLSTELSCLSSCSSARSLSRSRYKGRSYARFGSNGSVYGSGSAQMSRRADAILTFLSHGCSSEVNIRQVIGDSPDTSKALRMLLKLEEVKRSGTGGRRDPYIYTIV